MISYKILVFVSVISHCIAGIPLRRNIKASKENATKQTVDKLSAFASHGPVAISEFKAFLKGAQVFSPVLTVGTLTYVAYVGLSLLIPSTLARMDMPRLEIVKIEPRSFQNSINGVDALAGEFIKSLITKSEVGEAAIATSKHILEDSATVLKNVTRATYARALGIRFTIDKLIKALSPECLTYFMCRVGQITSFRFPLIGMLIRNLDSRHLDEYSQALIDGTTIGDCSGVFHECELEQE